MFLFLLFNYCLKCYGFRDWQFLQRYDVIVDATDNAPSRYMISDCCVVLGKVNQFCLTSLLD